MWIFECCKPRREATPPPEQPTTKASDKAPEPTTPPQSLELIRAHSRAGSRILQSADSGSARLRSGPSQSLLEASARRLASVAETDAPDAVLLDADDQGMPRKFITAYFDAIVGENAK